MFFNCYVLLFYVSPFQACLFDSALSIPFFGIPCKGKGMRYLLGTLRSENGEGSENVAEKVNSRSFNLHRDYSKSLALSNVGEPS